MSNLLPFLVAGMLSVAALQGRWDPAAWSPPGLVAFLVAWYGLVRGTTGWIAASAAGDGADPRRALARFRRVVSLFGALTLPGHAVLLWAGGWAWEARAVGDLPGVAVAFAPFLLLRLLARAGAHPAARRLGLEELPLARSLFRSSRVAGLLVVPVLLVLALFLAAGLLSGIPRTPFVQVADLAARYDFLGGALALAALAGVLLVFPVLAMRILGARPMAAGALRGRLEAYAARVGLRYRDLYVWDTAGAIPNAAVMGVGRRLRCVVFTDALLDRLDDEEVEAVFAHEAGHALHGHLPLFFVFTVAYSLGVFGLGRFLPADVEAALGDGGILGMGIPILGLLIYFGLVFGFVSRRLEQQADVHGLLTVGLPEGEDPARVLREPGRHPFLQAVAAGRAAPGEHPFVRSLDRIASVLGGVREISGWRHFSIADRVDFLERFAREASVRSLYRRRLRALLGILGAIFVGAAAAAATDLPSQLRGPSPGAALGRAAAALRRGDPEAARAWIRDGIEGARARGRTLADGPGPLGPGRTVERLSTIELGAAARDPRSGLEERIRARELEALLRSAGGRDAEAADCAAEIEDAAASAVEEVDPALRAEVLLLRADLLRRAGRPAAARAALSGAEEAARAAGSAVLLRAARRDG